MSQAIVLELSLVLFGHSKGLETSLVLELKTGFGCAVLHKTEHLDEQLWVLDYAAIATDRFAGDVGSANLTLVLDLDELDVGDEAKHLDDVSDDLVRWNCLDQLDHVVRLEVSHLVLHLPNDFEVGAAEHQLDVDVD